MTAPAKPHAGPPKEVPASSLWAALETMPRPWETVPFPRLDPVTKESVGEIAIWVLTQEEQIACGAEADKVAKALLKEKQAAGEDNLGYRDVYNNEVTVQVLMRACRRVEDVERSAFPSAAQLRKKLTVGEIGVLAREYLQVQAKLGPIVADMTADEEKAWIRRLAEGASAYPTAPLSPELLDRLLISMASQLVACWTAMSSSGSEPESSPSDTPASEAEAGA